MSGLRLKLNLGSGQRPFDSKHGWVNVDCQEKWKPDVLCDISKLPAEWEGTAEIIVLHHVLEHFGLVEGQELLKECWRVFEPGGRLLVFVPDQKALAQRWLMGWIDDYVYTVNLMGAYMGDEADRHKWGYCWRSLDVALRAAGFPHPHLFDWATVPVGANIAQDWWILGMQAEK